MGAFRCEMNDTAAAALHTRPLQIEHDLPRAITPHASRLVQPVSFSIISISPHVICLRLQAFVQRDQALVDERGSVGAV